LRIAGEKRVVSSPWKGRNQKVPLVHATLYLARGVRVELADG